MYLCYTVTLFKHNILTLHFSIMKSSLPMQYNYTFTKYLLLDPYLAFHDLKLFDPIDFYY